MFDHWFVEPFVDNFYDDLVRYRRQYPYHLNHSGGSPARDFYGYVPVSILKYCYSGGAIDEAHEEASQPFQNLFKLRKDLKITTPLQQIIEQLDDKNTQKLSNKSTRYLPSTYLKDSTHVMRDLWIDYHMFLKSSRLYSGLFVGIDIMQNQLQFTQPKSSVYEYFTFFSNGCVVVHCDTSNKIDNRDPLVISDFEREFTIKFFDPDLKCSFTQWIVATRRLADEANEMQRQSTYGLFN